MKSVIFMLYRKIQAFIEDHLRSDSDKILVIDGARQIGKTLVHHGFLWDSKRTEGIER